MKNYKNLIEQINRGEYIIFKADNPRVYQTTRFNREIADAFEQLVKERDAAIADLCELSYYEYDSCIYCAKDRKMCKMSKECNWECNWEWRGLTK